MFEVSVVYDFNELISQYALFSIITALLNLNGTNIVNEIPKELCEVPTLLFLYDDGIRNCSEHVFTSSRCTNPTRSWFTNSSNYLGLIDDDDESPFFSRNMQIGCDWLELHDTRSCPKYGNYMMDETGNKASAGCCYCEPPWCLDYPGWVDDDGHDCAWYKIHDLPECPNLGEHVASTGEFDGVSARDACCE